LPAWQSLHTLAGTVPTTQGAPDVGLAVGEAWRAGSQMHDALLTEFRRALGERFAIDREIGEGAYGTVFLARDAHGRDVALKVLRPELVVGVDRLRVLRELGMLSRLAHAHVLPVLESGEAADLLYYSTPFISGGSLQDRIRREGTLPVEETLRIADEIAQALEYAHAHGVIHRDVTARNVLFDSGRVLVKEFWIARALAQSLNDRMTAAGRVIGTPVYMSPEQLIGDRPVDARSDVYSLAVLVVEMLTGRPPFDSNTLMGVIARKMSGELSRRDLPAALPPGVAAPILRALAASPDQRFATARELVEACRAVALAKPAPIVSSPAAAPRRFAKRHRLLGLGLAALAAGGLVSALLSTWNQPPATVARVEPPQGTVEPPPVSPASRTDPTSKAPAPPLALLVFGAWLAGSALVVTYVLRRGHLAPAGIPPRVARPMATAPIDRLRAALQYQYEIDAELARGGMAVLYTARDRRYRGRKVAVKVLRPELAASVTSERFLEEIQITAQLTHPGILPLFDSGDADGRPFYVMPYIEGETLKDRIRREGRLTLDDALVITRDVARALDYAHRQLIVHRDVKPENILLHEGRAIVADFGIALALDRARDRVTNIGQSVGTPEYMSPEQFWDTKHIDHRSDLYSLGCVLYEMLAGEPPYSGTANELATRHLYAAIPRIRVVRPDVPAAVDAAICKALEKQRADRFDSASSMLAALTPEPRALASSERLLDNVHGLRRS
jgi:serine/threonine protein kinase